MARKSHFSATMTGYDTLQNTKPTFILFRFSAIQPFWIIDGTIHCCCEFSWKDILRFVKYSVCKIGFTSFTRMKLIKVLINIANEIILTDNKYYNASVTVVMRKQLIMAFSFSPSAQVSIFRKRQTKQKQYRQNLYFCICAPTGASI